MNTVRQTTVSARHALVICNGEPPRAALARQLARSVDIVVAADGGANVARKLQLQPDVIIGDLDSVEPATIRRFHASEIVRVSRQDNTDLEKSLDYLVAKNTNSVVIIAATGKRLDHTIGNLSVIWNYTSSLRMTFVGDGWYAVPVRKPGIYHATAGTTISLLPFGPCSGITLRGLKYPLTNAAMHVGEIGVSNVAVKSRFSVQVRKGNMLMVVLEPFIRLR